MKKILLLLVMILLPMVASADAVEIDGIYYNIIAKTQIAEVAPPPSGYYSGDIVIPEKIKFEEVEYPVEGIASNAFKGKMTGRNVGPTSVSIPSTIKTIGNSAFSFCGLLKAVYITDLSAWCNIAFDENQIQGNYSENISNPLYYAQHLYLNGEEVVNLVIPDGVKEIKKGAFWRDSIFTSISIPNSVEVIGKKCFEGCKGVVSIYIPEGIKTIGSGTFSGCSSLSSFTIPNSITEIEEYTFGGCSSLKNVLLHNGITKIGGSAFYGCKSLSNIHIPKSVKRIGSGAFEGCENIEKVTTDDIDAWCSINFEIPTANPLYYTHHLFINNEEVTEVSLPDNVDTLYCNFAYCQGIKTIKLNKGLKIISNNSFEGCTGLTNIDIPSSVISIGRQAFNGCTGLESASIPEGVSSIGNYAFYRCTNLTSISLPMSISIIGEGTFSQCSSLKTVKLYNVANIDDNSFVKCQNLKDLYCFTKEVPLIGTNSFIGSYIEYATLHVPEEAINKYKDNKYWSKFGTIVALTSQEYDVQKCSKPSISYQNGKLTFSSETEGAEFVTDITNADIKKHYDATITLTATYNISVYATKSGYDNSDVATATLCWIDQTPKTEGITNGVANIPANAVLIQSEGGTITVQGCDEGEQVSVYGINGTQAGTTFSQNGAAIVNTSLQPGSIAIVKIGQKSVKVVIK